MKSETIMIAACRGKAVEVTEGQHIKLINVYGS